MTPDETAGDILSPKQRRAVDAVLSADGINDAARAAGVSKETLYRWMRQPAFREALRTGEGEKVHDIARALAGVGREAVETLRGVMRNEDASDATKVRAADTLLGRLLTVREHAALEERLSAIERALEEKMP